MLVQSNGGEPLANMALSEYATNLTPALAMKEEMALSGLRKNDEGAYMKTVGLLLLRTVKLMNATNTIGAAQIADLTVRVTKRYYYFRLDELVYVLDRGVQGDYGRDFNRVDAGLIMGWLDQYDTGERLWVVESAREQSHVETPTEPLGDEKLTEYYRRVLDGEKTFVYQTPRFSGSEQDKQSEAMARYIQEKQAGLVQDYTKAPANTDQPLKP